VDRTGYAQRAVDLVNADLRTTHDLTAHLEHHPWLAEQVTSPDLAALRAVQAELAAVVDASAAGQGPAAVAVLNDLLARHPVRPGFPDTTRAAGTCMSTALEPPSRRP